MTIDRVETFVLLHHMERGRGPSIANYRTRESVLVKVTDSSGATGWGETYAAAGLPSVLRLHAPVPNPFNPATSLAFDVPQGDSAIRLDIIDMRGRVVARLLQAPLPPGRHAVTWNGRDTGGREVPSGVYVARLRAGETLVTRKLTLLR